MEFGDGELVRVCWRRRRREMYLVEYVWRVGSLSHTAFHTYMIKEYKTT